MILSIKKDKVHERELSDVNLPYVQIIDLLKAFRRRQKHI